MVEEEESDAVFASVVVAQC